MSYYLFLDDVRQPHEVTWVRLPQGVHWHIARNYVEFVKIVQAEGVPRYVTFDHDLADQHYANDYSQEKTGLDCAKWLTEYCMDHKVPFPQYAVHSMNPVGRDRIVDYVEWYLSSPRS